MGLTFGKIHQGDCVALLKKMDAGSVDLAFADPPFNIKYDYDVYKDNLPYHEYLAWTKEWMGEVSRVLKPNGTFWVAIGDEYAAEFKLILQNDLKLTCRSWVIWYYTFGVNCKYKFTRSHAHLFHFVKDAKKFTFNFQDPDLRVPSARQLVYGDSRAVEGGRLPDDTWILRPQDLPDGFTPDSDTWFFSRVAGTFKEREGFHGCQMPEQLLGRIVRACSREGDVVLDPFSGSATTLAVAKKMNRNWIGCELSKDYAKKGNARLATINAGEPLRGAENALTSAPKTSEGRRLDEKKRRLPKAAATARDTNGKTPAREVAPIPKAPLAKKDFERAIISAFLAAHEGNSTDRVILADPDLNEKFLDECRRVGVPGDPVDWNRMVLRLRKSRGFPRIESRKQKQLRWEEMDDFSFASEIAWDQVSRPRGILSLDDVLSDPVLAREFDTIASRFAQITARSSTVGQPWRCENAQKTIVALTRMQS